MHPGLLSSFDAELNLLQDINTTAGGETPFTLVAPQARALAPRTTLAHSRSPPPLTHTPPHAHPSPHTQYVATIPQAFVEGESGIVYDSSSRLYQPPNLHYTRTAPGGLPPRPARTSPAAAAAECERHGALASVIQRYGHMYFHFVAEALPRSVGGWVGEWRATPTTTPPINTVLGGGVEGGWDGLTPHPAHPRTSLAPPPPSLPPSLPLCDAPRVVLLQQSGLLTLDTLILTWGQPYEAQASRGWVGGGCQRLLGGVGRGGRVSETPAHVGSGALARSLLRLPPHTHHHHHQPPNHPTTQPTPHPPTHPHNTRMQFYERLGIPPTQLLKYNASTVYCSDTLLLPTPTPRITPPREALLAAREALGVRTLPEVSGG